MQQVRCQLLDQALDISRRMASLGREGEWGAVIELEPQRRAILQRAFATREPVDADLATRMRAILDIDRDLIDLSADARDRLAGELTQATRGRRVTRAYHNAGGV